MRLSRHMTPEGPRWARDGRLLAQECRLSLLLELPAASMRQVLEALPAEAPADGPLLAPLEPLHEVWASGVTYLRSRDARKSESTVGDVYEQVYAAERPEIFMKAIGWRVAGHEMPVRIRRDSGWDVPEPELVLVVNRHLEIVGYCAGNDMSSRAIEGQNPLYLPQAKMYDGSCALGPALLLAEPETLVDLPIGLQILRQEQVVFAAEVRTSQIKRGLQELVSYLGRELSLPYGAFLMTGTGIVPPDSFSLQVGDSVQVTVGELTLRNSVRT